MKFGRILRQVNAHRLTWSDFWLTSHFQDGSHDVILCRKVLPPVSLASTGPNSVYSSWSVLHLNLFSSWPRTLSVALGWKRLCTADIKLAVRKDHLSPLQDSEAKMRRRLAIGNVTLTSRTSWSELDSTVQDAFMVNNIFVLCLSLDLSNDNAINNNSLLCLWVHRGTIKRQDFTR